MCRTSMRRIWSRVSCCCRDLGNTTYLQALTPGNAQALYGAATDALIKIQLASRENELPPYDEALLRREMNLFPEWYVAKHLGVAR